MGRQEVGMAKAIGWWRANVAVGIESHVPPLAQTSGHDRWRSGLGRFSGQMGRHDEDPGDTLCLDIDGSAVADQIIVLFRNDGHLREENGKLGSAELRSTARGRS